MGASSRAEWKPDKNLYRVINTLLLGDLVAIVLLPLGAWGLLERIARPLCWLAVALIMLVFLIAIGLRTNGRPFGVFIDETNRTSLSRLQIALWTVLVMSAFFAIGLPRIFPGGMASVDDVAPDDPKLAACREELGDPTATAADCNPGALQVTFPPELILAMGISVTSFAGSTLIQSTKGRRELDLKSLSDAASSANTRLGIAQGKAAAAKTASKAAESARQQAEQDLDIANNSVSETEVALARAATDAERKSAQEAREAALMAQQLAQASFDLAKSEAEKAAKELETATAEAARIESEAQQAAGQLQAGMTQSQGLLYRNPSAAQASWIDLFRGNEIGNYQLVDMAKVQMFFFTIVVVVAYAAAVVALFGSTGALQHPLGVDLPPFSATLNTLLAISHGGYLSAKTIDHTKAAG